MKTVTIPVIAITDAIKTEIASVDTESIYTSGQFDGSIGAGEMNPARTLTVETTFSPGSYNPDSTITIDGTDSNDDPLSEIFTIVDEDGDEIIYGVLLFKTVTTITITPQLDSLGSFKVGIEASLFDSDAIKTSIASDTNPASYSGGDLDGLVGETAMSPLRRLTATLAMNAGSYIDSSEITFTGLDQNLDPLVEVVTIVGTDGGQTLITTGLFSSVDTIDVEAQADTDGAFEFGIAVVAADDNAIIENASATLGETIYSAGDLDGSIGGGLMVLPRTVSIQTSSSPGSYIDQSTITVRGLDDSGRKTLEVFTITGTDGGETLSGDVGFIKITSITVLSQTDTSGSFKFGVQDIICKHGPKEVRFGGAGKIKLSYYGVTDTIENILAGETFQISPNRIYGDNDTTVTKVSLVF